MAILHVFLCQDFEVVQEQAEVMCADAPIVAPGLSTEGIAGYLRDRDAKERRSVDDFIFHIADVDRQPAAAGRASLFPGHRRPSSPCEKRSAEQGQVDGV